LNTFNQHQSTSKRQLSAEQQEAARNHSENVALSLSQYMDSDCNDLSDECSICLDIPERNDIAITPCSHIFCRRCLLDTLNWDENNSIADPTRRKFGKCPFCMASIEISQIKFTGCSSSSTLCEEVSADEEVSRAVQRKDAVFNARETLEAALKGRCSSKITAILNELDHIWELDPRSKVVIFSQYLGMLDLIRKELINQEITHFKFDGKMSLNQRREILGKFSSPTKHLTNDDDQINRNHGSVLLASMKACGVGLNLVSASTVFIVDPWWNDAMEDQCVNRVHRIGQLAKIVRMRKFIVSDSVEEKIVEMQERKKGVATELLSNQKTGNNSGSNPTLDDFKTIFGR
jgi:DNA repair protein RAD5